MNPDLQGKAVQVARRFSKTVLEASRRIHTKQQITLREQAERKAKEKRLFDGRLSRAKRGLRRFLAFAKGKPIQRILKANGRLKGNHGLLFYEKDWNVIGSKTTSRIAFHIGLEGVSVTMTNFCHITDTLKVTFAYKGQEVMVRHEFGFVQHGEWTPSSDDTLRLMADASMFALCNTIEEGEAAFLRLASWSRAALFEKAATAFLEDLELKMA